MSLSKELLAILATIDAKRPKTVIQHILEHGHVTSQELKDLYGYNHPPRAVRDVRERGIPIDTYTVIGSDGRKIAAYKFGDLSTVQPHVSKTAGRTVLSKAIKKALIEKFGARCFIYNKEIPQKQLQVDHRVPYEISGEQPENIDFYMLLSPSANRAKSWTCEHCINWLKKNYSFCVQCFWSHPEKYTHVAGNSERVIYVVFSGDEIKDFEKLIAISGLDNAQDTIKELIHDYL